jgi:hypothetical protein
MDEAEGSSPSSSTRSEPSADRRRLGFAFGGLVAAEGTFSTSRLRPDRADGTQRTRFVFALTMATRDEQLVLGLRKFLGAGSITRQPPRRAHWEPTITLTISGRRSHNRATIPFADAYLLPSAKRDQYERWRDDLAAEGHFGHSGRRFSCTIALGASDEAMCRLVREFLGVGRVHRSTRRRPHYDDEVVWVVGSLPDLVEVLVPFVDEHLPPSYKREQYEDWRAALVAYWETRARRPKPCTVDRCDDPRRARGLCRHHYWLAYRR